MFSDDNVIVSCITGDYRISTTRCPGAEFVKWSDSNHLRLNTVETKELVVDYHSNKRTVIPTSLHDDRTALILLYIVDIVIVSLPLALATQAI